MSGLGVHLEPYEPILAPHAWPYVAAVTLLLGFFSLAMFFTQEVSKQPKLFKELYLAFITSVFLGLGVVFLTLTAGIYF